MTALAGRLRRDPGHALALLAIVLAVIVFAPTVTHGLVNYDDPWLVQNNWILREPSLHALHAVFFDVSRDTRTVLGAEYLPVRDVSVMLDHAVWGAWYGGHHLTNVALYVVAIALWFTALVRFGVDRTVAGLAVLVWAVHPSHVETVAWLSERKGVLSTAVAGGAALAYAKYRAGESARWLAVACLAAVAAVWSKALGAFAIAALGGLELALPGRASVRRSVVGLGILAAATAAAMVPVLVVATRMQVVSTDGALPVDGDYATVCGIHGFYLRLAALGLSNAVSYPIDSHGPGAADFIIGIAGFVAIAAVFAMRSRAPAPLRAACLVWLIGWFPASRIVLPVRLVIVADRYLLVPSLGVALAIAVGIVAIPRRSIARALAIAIVIASVARSIVAVSAWRDADTLWSRAVASNPDDGNAWSMYAEALLDAGDVATADAAIETGLARTQSPRLMLRRALSLVRRGDHEGARTWMTRAAEAGEPTAMSNLALMLHDAGDRDGALRWARQAVATSPLYAQGYRVLGKIALEWRVHDEARVAFERAIELEPAATENRYNLALALIALGRIDDARRELTRCLESPRLAPLARAQLEKLR